MKVEVIEWQGMGVGQVLELTDDYAGLLIEQGKVKEIKDVKVNKRSRNSIGDSDVSGSEGLAKGDENE